MKKVEDWRIFVKKFDVKIIPHDAMSDIEATRELGHIYKKAFLRKE